MSRRFAIAGGGLLGMALAERVRAAGHEVTIFEAAPELGGLAAPWQLGDITWDRHYHVSLASDAHLMGLLRRLGLESRVQWRPAKTGVYANGALHSVSSAVEFFRFPGLGAVDRARVAATVLRAATLRDPSELDTLPVETWLRRWSGDRAFERFWQPLLRSKLGESYRDTPATFIWATIARLYAARRSGMREERFGYISGGYRTILERFEASLTAAGVEVRTNAPVRSIVRERDGLRVDTPDGSSRFDEAVVTAPAPIAAAVCAELSPRERESLLGVRYLGIVCASLLLARSLSPFYTTNLTDDGFPFTGIIEMSAFVDTREFGGASLVYLPRYCAPDDPLFMQRDETIAAGFLEGLRRVHPQIAPSDVLATRISRVRHVFALPSIDRPAPIPMRTSVPGLSIVTSAQIVHGTLNVNETLALAERSARELLREAQSTAPARALSVA